LDKPYIAKRQTYLNDDKKTTFTVFHPAIKFNNNEEYCYFPDEGTKTGLVEHSNEKDCIDNAKTLYRHYVLNER